MEVPRQGVKSELRLLAYTAATAMWDLGHLCDLLCSAWLCRILNPLREARDRTHILMDTSQFLSEPPAEPQWELPQAFFMDLLRCKAEQGVGGEG